LRCVPSLGPRYLLPAIFEADGYRVYFTLVDIASAEVSGRRQRHAPSSITLDDLLERLDDTGSAQPARENG
jgi:hypothetical protein